VETEDGGFKVGFEEGETLEIAGKVLTMQQLATLHELGTEILAARPHWGPTLHRFKARTKETAELIVSEVLGRFRG
jgi:hypothetical protein